MKVKSLFSVVALGVLLAGGAYAADSKEKVVDDNLIGLTTENGKIVYDFINMWFNEKKGEAAWDKYVSRDNYMNHAVYSARKSQKASFEEEKKVEARIGADPDLRFNIKQIISQGSLVFVHIHALPKPGVPGDQMVMILRVRDGKIIDHWDIHTEMNAESVVFDDLVR